MMMLIYCVPTKLNMHKVLLMRMNDEIVMLMLAMMMYMI